jgi:N-acetylmuramoyl-L-alanine amidase
LPGDVLVIPDKRLRLEAKATEMRHRFRRKAVPAKVRIVLHDHEGKPRASLQYRAIIDGAEHQGKTDSDGALELAIPPNARDGTLMLGEFGSEVHDLELGGIDPIETLSGAQQRLTNLGFACDHTDGQLDDTTRSAIREFQEQHQLHPTGSYDTPTQD